MVRRMISPLPSAMRTVRIWCQASTTFIMSGPTHFATKNSFVEEQIRAAVVRGDVLSGDWIRPDEWARRLGVSQTPIREALRKLEA
jgi:DNA-binding GntR family transcriptional regulator